jgi:LemA protein
MTPTIIIIGIAVILALFFITVYNRLVRLRNNREQAFSDIDVQLKQRHDLIPQLVNTVKGYMKHEEGVLTEVTAARAGAIKAGTINEKIEAETRLTRAMQGLQISVEAYPDLKANQNFMNLQEEISDIENKLAASRRFFNSATKELNNAVEVFPANMVAGMFGFKRETMFDLGDSQRADLDKTPEINFQS